MGNNKIEYIIRIGPSDRYRHLHIKERGKIVFLKKTPLFNQDLNDALTFAENDLKTNWELYKKRFLEGMYDEQRKGNDRT